MVINTITLVVAVSSRYLSLFFLTLQVSSGIPWVLMYSYAPAGFPPSQVPPPLQLIRTCKHHNEKF